MAGLADTVGTWAALAKHGLEQAYQTATWDAVINRIVTAPGKYRVWWLNLWETAPGHVIVETALIVFIFWLLFLRKTEDPSKEESPLKESEIEELIRDWKPEPLCPPPDPEWEQDPALVVREVRGNQLFIEGINKPLLNLATFDFLGLSQRPQVKDAARKALDKYGCGSCGPRGFYGSIDVHVLCEEAFAAYFKAEEAISYSDSASAVSSTLPAFAKKGDLLIVDEGVHEPIQTAVTLSRSRVKYFKHNDMLDLERVLKEIEKEDKRVKRNTIEQRRFIVVEGLYKNSGSLVPLQEVVRLKNHYKYRLYLDQTFAFGTLGAGGRGVPELFNVPLEQVEITTVSMAHALASVGGLCIGTTEVVDHQRLSGAGYCFSASAPPFVSAAAMAALELLGKEPELVQRLGDNAALMHDGLKEMPGLEVISDRRSPIIHVGVDPSLNLSRHDAVVRLRKLSQAMIEQGYAVVTSKYLDRERYHPPPTLRITVNAAHTPAELKAALATLRSVARSMIQTA